MADFVSIKSLDDATAWINLDHVVRIDVGRGDDASTSLSLSDGSTVMVGPDAGKKLVKQLGRKKKKKKKKKKAPESADAAGSPPPTPPSA